jgi:hypothetical protein
MGGQIVKKLLTLSFVLIVLMTLSSASAFATATITIVNVNAAGVGFNDPTPATPVGGNPGTTLGAQRLYAFQYAAGIWGATLDSPVEIRIQSSFVPLSCTATAATLGSAGTIQVVFNFAGYSLLFPGEEFPNTLYHIALANKRAGVDLIEGPTNTTADDIRARFNSEIGKAGCLTGTTWYLGVDGAAGANQINLVEVLLHEFAHGLGFSQFGSVTTGANLAGYVDVYNRQIFDDTQNKQWPDMTDAQRQASAINPRRVVWTGQNVTDAVPQVLSQGVPQLRITAPGAIAGYYEVGTASFGPALTAAGVTGQIVAALDGTSPASDACTAITNPASVFGRIALVDRGTCTFNVKAANVQAAGAIAMIVADNAAGGPPAGLGGTDATITIPAVRITLADGNAIKAQLGAGVQGTLSLDMSMRAGADVNGRALLYTPNPVIQGSTISHFDTIDFPNQLMEPNINSDLTQNVKPPYDMTLPLLRDVGWFADADNDGLADASDQCVHSDLTNMTAPDTIKLGACDTTVTNVLFTSGCTIKDFVAQAGTGVKNHGAWASNMAHLGEALVAGGIITDVQKDAMQACAAKYK